MASASPGYSNGIFSAPALQPPGGAAPQSRGLLDLLQRLLGQDSPYPDTGPEKAQMPQPALAPPSEMAPAAHGLHAAGEEARAVGDETWAAELHSLGQLFLHYATSDINALVTAQAQAIVATMQDTGESVH